MTSHGVARDQLIAFVGRVERIEADIKEKNSDKSDVYSEAKSLGLDVKVLKKVVAKRRMDSAERDEQDAIFDMYWDAIHGSSLVHARVRGNVEEFAEDTATNNRGEPNEVATHATSNAKAPVLVSIAGATISEEMA